jgi:hypothetical protein
VLIPLPSEDDTLLGRVLPGPPPAGQSLAAIARPNPCGDKLTEVQRSPLSDTFQDAQELSVGAGARAVLGPYGFQGDAEHATHFFYRLETAKQESRTDTNDYVACCKAAECGYGYVSALVYGDGEYATGEETQASGQVDFIVGSAQGNVRLRALHRRKVHGYVAALVAVTDPAKAVGALGVLGTTQAAGIKEEELPATVKQIYDNDKLSIAEVADATTYTIKDGRGAAITENEFVRRYKKVTGSDELADYDQPRHPGIHNGLIAVITVDAALVAGGVIGLAAGDCLSSDNSKIAGWCGVPLGATLVGILGSLGVFGVWMAADANPNDGNPSLDHFISESDARLYVTRYNRALLRKDVRDTQKVYQDTASVRPAPGLTMSPWLGLGSAGLQGRF